MIQDIGEHTFDNQYHPCPPDRESYALYYEDHAALVENTRIGSSSLSFGTSSD